ncbi:fimbrial biogenesis usher protein [Enterobacter ludwigii]
MKIRITRSLIIASLMFPLLLQAADSPSFDVEILKNRGLDTSLSDYFSDAPKFMPGRHRVELTINGQARNRVTARFGSKGELCADSDFLHSAGLVIPDEIAKGDENSYDCHDYLQAFPSTIVSPLPGQGALELIVPQEALAAEGVALGGAYQTGGTAALLNYSAFTSQNRYAGTTSSYSQLSLEEGLNMHDWLLRSRQMVSQNDTKSTVDNLYTYVQHTFVHQNMLMQAGQINITNTLFSGTAINGVQMIPENALRENSGSGVSVSGIAQMPQARVEIRQSGIIVFSTLVPAGPFTLNNIPITQVNTSLDVTVRETDGSESHFIIPAEAVQGNQLGGPQGLSVAVGQTRDISTQYDEPWLLTASDGWRITPWMNASAGLMAAQRYAALASGADVVPFTGMLLSGIIKVADDQYGNNQGQSSSLSVNYSPGYNVNLTASAAHYTTGYRELQDTLQTDSIQYAGQYSTTIGWSSEYLGRFSFGYSRSKGTKGQQDSSYLNASWGRSFGRGNISVNWQSMLNESDDSHRISNRGDLLYVKFSIPLGQQQISTYMRKRGDLQSVGMQTGGILGAETSYSLTAERELKERENSFNAGLNTNLRYTQLSLGAGTSGADSRNYSATLSGGMVAGGGGVTFSPNEIKDTFALVKMNDDISGVQISTPSGDVWTDRWGRAVVSSLPAYRNARVEINTGTLPGNVDVNNGVSMIMAGHGAVSTIDFDVVKVRRAMIKFTTPGGQRIQKGASALDEQGNYIATVVEDGVLFLNDAEQQPRLFIVSDTGIRQCEIIYRMNDEPEEHVFFENVAGVCK